MMAVNTTIDSAKITEKIRAVRSSFPFFSESIEMIKLKLLIFNQSFPELIENEINGYLVNFGDIDEFCAKVESLIQSKELRDTMGQNARQKILQKFDFHKSVLQLEGLINEHNK